VVGVSTLIGYSLYVHWKEDSFALKYRNSIYKLTAELFKDKIAISNVSVGNKNSQIPSSVPFVKGSLKNNSAKTVSSVLIELVFQEPNGIVVYKDWIYPLGVKKTQKTFPLFYGLVETSNVLLPGEGISFRHPLRNCPSAVLRRITEKTNFARKDEKNAIEISCSVVGLDLL